MKKVSAIVTSFVLAFILGVSISDIHAGFQDPSKPIQDVKVEEQKEPVLSNEMKLSIQNLIQQLQLAEQSKQIATMQLQTLLQQLQVEGYALDLGTLTYIKK